MLVTVDPHYLNLWVEKHPFWRIVPRRRGIPLETMKRLSFLRRSLQALPPRELQFLYLVQVKGVTQSEACGMYQVSQQNLSYRINKASDRIGLHHRIYNLCSETRLHRTLLDLGFDNQNYRAIMGVVKTSSQSETARSMGVSETTVRVLYQKALTQMEETCPESPEHRLLKLIARNLNGLACIRGQARWHKKKTGVGSGDRPQGRPLLSVGGSHE